MKKVNLYLIVVLLVGLLSVNALAATDDQAATRLDAVRSLVSAVSDYPEFRNIWSIFGMENTYDMDEIEAESDKEVWASAIENGLIGGYTDGSYRPNAPLTRAEYAVMVQNASRFLTQDKITEIKGLPYQDLSDWNAQAVKYCIERGYMLGYGTVFGAEDTLLVSQCELVKNRVVNGATAYEKYMVLSLSGESPLKMDKIINDLEGITPMEYSTGLYDQRIAPLGANTIYRLSNQYIWEAWNFDHRIADDAFIKKQVEIICSYAFAPPKDSSEIDKWTGYLTKSKENQVIRESFMVTSPNLCAYEYRSFANNFYITKGYLYFIYHNGEDGLLPVDQEMQIENNKWYRQKVVVQKTVNTRLDNFEIILIGESTEPVPDELLN